jgi:hypothetical protein
MRLKRHSATVICTLGSVQLSNWFLRRRSELFQVGYAETNLRKSCHLRGLHRAVNQFTYERVCSAIVYSVRIWAPQPKFLFNNFGIACNHPNLYAEVEIRESCVKKALPISHDALDTIDSFRIAGKPPRIQNSASDGSTIASICINRV